jgi:hypothetical protein
MKKCVERKYSSTILNLGISWKVNGTSLSQEPLKQSLIAQKAGWVTDNISCSYCSLQAH